MHIEMTQAVYMDSQQQCGWAELIECSGLSEAELEELVSEGLLRPGSRAAGKRMFGGECLVTARTARRLRDELDLDTHGVVVAMRLLDRISGLENELRSLRAQLLGSR